MAHDFDALRDALTFTPDPSACAETRRQLEAYVAAQLLGRETEARFAAVARHLDACVACAEQYADLYAIAEARLAGTLPDGARFDPARLPDPRDPALRLRQALERARDGVRVRLAPLLQPAWLLSPRPVFRSPVETVAEAHFEEEFDALLGDLAELSVTVTATREAESAEVRVDFGDFGTTRRAGREVTLSGEGYHQAQRSRESGQVIFTDVPLEALAALQIFISD